MTCEEAKELITALVDQELLDAERDVLEPHLQECPSCRLEVEHERLVKQTLRERAERMQAPAELRDRILSDRRIFPEKSGTRWQDYLWPMPHLARPALAAAVLLAIVLPAFFFFQSSREPVAAAALESYDLFRKGALSVRRTENPAEIVEQLTRAVGEHFHPMGYDLTAMHLRPVAGFVREIQGRKILVVIYQGQGGTLFCYTFFGSEEDAPGNAARFHDTAKRMNFYAFSRSGLNAVLHREGEIICVLASEMPMEELLALARSKARPS
ncbi:MAG TPA: zf-HC2 domain-containing protein [Candidatus Udaeobacter sp.]|jgi:anti-sigma factor (TIGR02949 family)|nr:zf-HC2 domain-containing protein [Candidatus Udaeobacter sp.]